MSTELVPKATIAEMVLHREKALEAFAAGQKLLLEADAAAARAARCEDSGGGFRLSEAGGYHSPGQIKHIDPVAFRKDIDRHIWYYLLEATQVRTTMGYTDLKALEDQLDKDPPEATYENIVGTMARLFATAPDMLAKSVAEAFEHLSHEYKTNNEYRFTKRIIYNFAFSPHWGSFYATEACGRMLYDLEKAMLVLEGRPVTPQGEIVPLVCGVVRGMFHCTPTPAPWCCGNAYFKVTAYKKGSLHIEFKRDDLLEKLNLILAKVKGAVLSGRKC